MWITSIVVLSILLSGIGAAAQSIEHGEMLGRPTDRSVNISLSLSEQAEICVAYRRMGSSVEVRTLWKLAAPRVFVDVVIQGLEPSAAYEYRVVTRRNDGEPESMGPVRTFHTQRTPGTGFTFVVQADPHLDEQSDTALYRRCLQNQLEDRPDFMIDLGDILMSDKLKNASGKITRDTIVARCHLLRSYYETICHSIPLFIALGNHEGEAGWLNSGTAENIPVWGTNARKEFFRNPLPGSIYTGDTASYAYVGQREAYYAWQWGDALFIVLDPYWFTKPKPDSLNGWRWTLGADQYAWLERTLRTKSARWTFVFAHQLVGGDPDGRGGTEYSELYEWGGRDRDGTYSFPLRRPGWQEPIKDLFRRYRVTAFFHGHDHFYAQQVKDCLVYQEVPQPSHPNVNSAGQADDYGYHEGVILPNSGHMRVRVEPDRVLVEYVRAYLPAHETGQRRNRDVSATWVVGPVTCYDSLSTSVPVLWNPLYLNDHIAPNPVRDATTISFTLERDDRPTLVIADMSGHVVRKLLHGSPLAPGSYSVLWDGSADGGWQVPSGTYRYRLTRVSGEVTGGSIVVTR